jgi:molybdate/tungstate transport system substrate-binding protein
MRVGPILAAGALSGLALLAAACGTNTTTPAAGKTTSSPNGKTSKGSGPVDVLYAASLEATMNSTVGPAFDKATGYTFVGYPDSSGALEADIKDGIKPADVFVSASPLNDHGLEGSSNGSWVSWYATFAETDVVLGYNPKSRFASQLKTKPWYQVVGEPGFKIGFTNPATDPKGVLSVKALDAAASRFGEPQLKAIAGNVDNQYPEAGLVGELQSGQLDAGFFFTVEATAARIPNVSLSPLNEASPYTVSALNKAPHTLGADSFVAFLLGAQGKALLSHLKLRVLTPPRLSGTGVPPALRPVLPIS